MTQTLDEVIAAAVSNAINAESIKERVQKAADKAVDDAISGAFSYSSTFRRGLQDLVSEALPVVKIDDLATFAAATRSVIQSRLSELASETARKHVGDVIDALIPDDPVVEFSELKKALVEKANDEHGNRLEDYDEGTEVTWEVEKSSNALTSEYWGLTCATGEGVPRFSPEAIHLRFRPCDHDPSLHECWDASGYGEGGNDSPFIGPLYGFDAMVFRLRTGLAKLRK